MRLLTELLRTELWAIMDVWLAVVSSMRSMEPFLWPAAMLRLLSEGRKRQKLV